MRVLEILAPVFLLIALGTVLRRTGFLSAELIQGTARLVYWVGLPALLFRSISTTRVEVAEHWDLLVVLLAGTAAMLAAGYAVAAALRAPRGATGTLVQASFRGNLAYVGLPILVYASAPADADATGATAALLLGATVPVYSLLAVTVLLADRHRLGLRAIGRIGLELLRNPLLLACLAGGAWALARIPLPPALDRTLDALGRMSLPLALLGVGGSLEVAHLGGPALRLALATSLIKVGVGPLTGLVLGPALALSSTELSIACVYLACPTAAATFVLADQLGGDRGLAAAGVTLSTALSVPALWAVVAAVA